MPLDIGRLDRRITIQSATLAQNAIGEPIPTWSDLAEVWAGVTVAGQEIFDGQQRHATHTTTFRIRWRTDVTAQMRVLFPVSGGDTYDIESVVEIGRQVGLDLETVASVS